LCCGLVIGSPHTAVAAGRSRSRRPCSIRRAGRTNTSKDTNADTGLPGRPNTGTRLDTADHLGHAGLHGDLEPGGLAEVGDHVTDEVADPADTPPVMITTSAWPRLDSMRVHQRARSSRAGPAR
jgi:hypothetical protein